jgi:hypothetical protein
LSFPVPMSLLAGRRVLLPSPCPSFDLWSEPELAAALPQVHDRSGHIRVAVLIGADAVRLAQPQDFGHGSGIDEVLAADGRRHRQSLRLLTDQRK